MDTSETYIKMRIRAAFDLPIKKADGELHYFGEGIFIDFKGNLFIPWLDGWLDLPRQDQLQEMVLFNKSPCQLSSDFYWWHTNQPWSYPNIFTSMEQLLFAFVMNEKYNKTWDGEDWVKTS